MSKKWTLSTLLVLAPFFVGCTESPKKEPPQANLDASKLEAPKAAVDSEKQENPSTDTVDVDKISETLGHLIVRHLDNPGFKFNIEKIMVGMKDEKEGKPAPMNEEEYEQTIGMIQENIFTKLSEKNLTAANEFLEKNAKEEGVNATNPKLQYKVNKEGEGDLTVGSESTPLVHYTGKMIDGTVFSSSVDTNHPIPLCIKQTIPGFSEGLLGMKKGEKRTLYIHPELAYGVSGHLPPNSLLIFEVEVLEIEAKSTAAAAEAKSETAETEEVKVEATVQ